MLYEKAREQVTGLTTMKNLFERLPQVAADPKVLAVESIDQARSDAGAPDEELIDVLFRSPGVRIERIVSTGQSSPEGIWYDQDEHEWVVMLSGEAELLFENESSPRQLSPGDYLYIPAHQRHRVESTSESELTIWLACFFDASSEGESPG